MEGLLTSDKETIKGKNSLDSDTIQLSPGERGREYIGRENSSLILP